MTFSEFLTFSQRHLDLNPNLKDVEISIEQGGPITGLGFGRNGVSITHECYPEIHSNSTLKTFSSIVELAGFEIKHHYQLNNPYWPTSYLLLKASNPWWLFETQYGLIEIGWRKRVISVSWHFVDTIVTEDEVTKSHNEVHASSLVKCLEYLTTLQEAAHRSLKYNTL